MQNFNAEPNIAAKHSKRLKLTKEPERTEICPDRGGSVA
jgi:hypothetical protein